VTEGAWSPVWDEVFASRPWGRYPPEELVAWISRGFDTVGDRAAVRVLEVGCGPGANLWYLAREGFAATGIDGSRVALGQARDRLATDGLAARLVVGDLAALPFESGSFDAVIDVASIQHNPREAQRRIVGEVHRVLRPEGRFLGLMHATGSWGEGSGEEIEAGTYRDMTEGPGVGCGLLHFFTEPDLAALFAPFRSMTYERRERTLHERRNRIVHWIVSATR
jgi:SAM-dependent methyltransferase